MKFTSMMSWLFKEKPKRISRNYLFQIGNWMFDFETMHAKMHPRDAMDQMVTEANLVWSQDNVRVLEIEGKRLIGEHNFFVHDGTQEELNMLYRRHERQKVDEAFENQVLDGPTCG